MQTRRILLLITLVLGGTALVAALGSPSDTREGERSTPAAPLPAPTSESPEVRFSGNEPQTRRPREGARVTVVVDPGVPGDVQLTALGLVQTTDGRTPVRFEILARDTDVRIHEVGGRSRLLGRLVVRPPRRRG